MGGLVRMEISGVDVYSQVALSGADEEIVEVIPYAESTVSRQGVLTYKGVDVVEWTVIDTYQASNWIGAGARTTKTDCQSKATVSLKTVGSTANVAVWGAHTYPWYGYIAGMNAELAAYDADGTAMSTITAANLRKLDIPLKTASGNALTTGIYNAWVAQGKKDLDYDTLYAIASAIT